MSPIQAPLSIGAPTTAKHNPTKLPTEDALLAASDLALAFGGQLVIPSNSPDSNPETLWESVIGLIKAKCVSTGAGSWDNPIQGLVKNPANWYGDYYHDQLVPPWEDGGVVFRFQEPLYFLHQDLIPSKYQGRSTRYIQPKPGPITGHWRPSYCFMRQPDPGVIDRVLLVFVKASAKTLASHPGGILVGDLLNGDGFVLHRVVPVFNLETKESNYQ